MVCVLLQSLGESDIYPSLVCESRCSSLGPELHYWRVLTGAGAAAGAILMSISGRAPDQNVESWAELGREFLGLGHPEQGGDAPVPLHGGAAPGLGGGGSSLLSNLLQLPVIADEAWKISTSKHLPFHGISYFGPLHSLFLPNIFTGISPLWKRQKKPWRQNQESSNYV